MPTSRCSRPAGPKLSASTTAVCVWVIICVHRQGSSCIDEILGAGASDRLGLDENNAAPIYDVLDAINEACKAEKQHYADRIPKPQPMNRAQRRAEKKARQRTQTAGHIVSQQPVSFPAQPPAAQMVERVDKAARRKALLAELAALEND